MPFLSSELMRMAKAQEMDSLRLRFASAAGQDSLDEMHKLWQRGVKMCGTPSTTSWGALALHRAAYYGAQGAAEKLLTEYGVYVDSRHYVDRVTPYIVASRNGKAGMARLLLKHGADPKLVDVNGLSANCLPRA